MASHRYLERHGNSDELVVALHGFAGSSERLAAVRETIADILPDADVFTPVLPFAQNWLCSQKAESIVAGLMREVDQIVAERATSAPGYERISFVGHSFGAVLARRLVITAFGEQHDPSHDRPAPFEPELAEFREARSWAGLIKRIVLLAGMNRGWTVSSAMDWKTTVEWSVLQFLGETIPFRRPTVFAIRRGAPFLAQTRLQWLALMSPDYGPRPDLITVQLLGSGDDQVSPDDNVDYSVDLFGAAGSKSYFYVEVPFSTHPSVVQMAKEGPEETQLERNLRRSKFTLALKGDRDQLAREAVTREQMADNLPPEPVTDVTDDVVFVIHGIRDKGFWTQKIARTIKKHARKGQRIESWTESYGYFAMLPFILRRVRQRKVEWLMDCYTEARARYPKAHFHCVAHSNGTYLMAQALQDYPAARFKYIVFAGSVVRRNYDWLSLIQRNPDAPDDKSRVVKVLNYVATRDWVVAVFPKGLQPWRVFNLGSAGHDGFCQASTGGPVHEVKYIIGAHSAGHEEPNWDDIAHFIVSGNPPPRKYPPFAAKQNRLWRIAGSVSFIVFPLIVAAIIGVGLYIFTLIFTRPASEQAGLTVGFLLYLWIVYLFVTRF
jgi:pimeloyl-ACP methyl ester carboxylesterase